MERGSQRKTDDSPRDEQSPSADEYDLAGDDAPPSRASAEPTDAQAGIPVRSAAAADITARYPRRAAAARTAAADEATADEPATSPLKDLYLPLTLLVLGVGLRVAQVLFAGSARGNQWWGSANAGGGGVAKALLLVLFEMIIVCAIAAVGAVVAAILLSVEFGRPGRAAIKLCAAAVFATGVACWIALFDRGSFSVAGLVLALHVMVVIYWIALGYLFSLDLQELLLTVAVITLAQSVAILGLWRGG